MPIDHDDDPARASIDTPHLDAGAWRLRPLDDADSGFVFSALNDPDMRRARSALPPADEAAAMDWVKRAVQARVKGAYAPWVLLARDSDSPIGMIVLQAVVATAPVVETVALVADGSVVSTVPSTSPEISFEVSSESPPQAATNSIATPTNTTVAQRRRCRLLSVMPAPSR